MEKVPTVHRTIREQVAAHLRYAVLSGDLGEGEALREQPLARHFGVSRGPVRDALLQLTQEGLLVAEQNCGVRVRRPDPAKNLSLFQVACRTGEMAEVVEHDMAFHRHIVECGGGADLVAVWVPVVTHMMLPYSRHRDLMDSYREHEAVVAALRCGDKAVAQECLRANIQ
jgi:DNA-binding GntR family transcriptional regulator